MSARPPNQNHTWAVVLPCRPTLACHLSPTVVPGEPRALTSAAAWPGGPGPRVRLSPLGAGTSGPAGRPRPHAAPGGSGGSARGGAAPDGRVSGGPRAWACPWRRAPSPTSLASGCGVRETCHSKSVLLSCLEARHLFIPFSFIRSLERLGLGRGSEVLSYLTAVTKYQPCGR